MKPTGSPALPAAFALAIGLAVAVAPAHAADPAPLHQRMTSTTHAAGFPVGDGPARRLASVDVEQDRLRTYGPLRIVVELASDPGDEEFGLTLAWGRLDGSECVPVHTRHVESAEVVPPSRWSLVGARMTYVGSADLPAGDCAEVRLEDPEGGSPRDILVGDVVADDAVPRFAVTTERVRVARSGVSRVRLAWERTAGSSRAEEPSLRGKGRGFSLTEADRTTAADGRTGTIWVDVRVTDPKLRRIVARLSAFDRESATRIDVRTTAPVRPRVGRYVGDGVRFEVERGEKGRTFVTRWRVRGVVDDCSDGEPHPQTVESRRRTAVTANGWVDAGLGDVDAVTAHGGVDGRFRGRTFRGTASIADGMYCSTTRDVVATWKRP